jgi:AraC-like DNA-binding protein
MAGGGLVGKPSFQRSLAHSQTPSNVFHEAPFHEEVSTRSHSQRQLHVSKIAWLLGFQDVSAFTHACKRWTGKTPSQMRTTGVPADHLGTVD